MICESRRERGVGELEAALVVALAGGAVRDGVGLFLLRDFDLRLAMSGRAMEVPRKYWPS